MEDVSRLIGENLHSLLVDKAGIFDKLNVGGGGEMVAQSVRQKYLHVYS